MLHRIREAWSTEVDSVFSRPVEVDETYIGGRRKNMPKGQAQGADRAWQGRQVSRRGGEGSGHLSAKHLNRYVAEFVVRYNVRERDMINQMASVVAGMVGKRLMYRNLIA